MAASDDSDSAAERLEAALERIVAALDRRAPALPSASVDLVAIAGQLDALITMVNGALAGTDPPRVTEAEPGQG